MKPENQNPRRVKLLPDTLINRIAAGEVVERPAAVLKELVENSLDAGADQIDIEVQGGGKRLIRVRDNGRGMDEDDLFMCLERHATSKLDPDSDLMAIGTLGFRGEALPSIGAVSHLTITSATEGGEGHLISVVGGRTETMKPVPANRGTTVEVARLFFNVPARLKFLKTDQTESAHLLDVARSYALSRDGLRLTYRDGGQETLSVEGRHDFRTRVYRVLGRAAAESLRPFEYRAGGLGISGWLGEPHLTLRSTSNLFIYVLGRPVRDRLLNRALADGYGRLLAPGAWPTAVVFIDLDPADVDVNVHPAKAEVRFRQPGAVFSALSTAVSRAVGRSPVPAAVPEAPAARPAPRPAAAHPPVPETLPFDPPGRPDRPPRPPWMIDEAGLERPEEAERVEFPAPPPPSVEVRAAAAAPSASAAPFAPTPLPEPDSSPEADYFVGSGVRPGPHDRPVNFEDLRPLAQLYQSYILAQGPAGLYIIDQHAAHERLIFNQLKASLAREGLPGQALLFPDTADLPPQQALAAEELAPQLRRLGFELQPFGGRTFLLKSAPAILGPQDPWPPLLEILGAAQGQAKSREGAGLNEALESLANSWLYSLACRAAIKAGEKMTLEAMARLIADLSATPHGAFCPHGRPSIQFISRQALEKNFHRR